ncbi:MAG: P-loop NTPase fold protein, partial [Pseudomonadota bacterium]
AALLPAPPYTEVQSAFGEAADLEIALQPSKWWERDDPDAVMRDIAAIVEKHKGVADGKISPENTAAIEPAAEGYRQHAQAHDDQPTTEDELGRRPFARVLVRQMNDLRKTCGDMGFAAHLHAPWGAGKTSILLMMEELMDPDGAKAKRARAKDAESSAERNGADHFRHCFNRFFELLVAPFAFVGHVALHCVDAVWNAVRMLFGFSPYRRKTPPADEAWVVVHYNAWEHENRTLPWWPLIEAVKTACAGNLDRDGERRGKRRINRKWFLWKLRADWFPMLIAVVALCALSIFWWGGVDVGPQLEFASKIIASLVAVFATFIAVGRTLFFGSNKNAKFYFDLSDDPMKRIRGLFEDIVASPKKPICVFIDDLDRCSEDFVVDFLEGVQTTFRHKNVAYVVASDRDWIRAAFRKRYEAFAPHVGEADQPLGFLFLQKIFQLSTPIPGMGVIQRDAYMTRLLEAAEDPGAQAEGSDEAAPLIEAASRKEVEAKKDGIKREAGVVSAEVAQSQTSQDGSQAMREALVELAFEGASSERARTHLLSLFIDHIPENPRFMKRLINAFAFRQAIQIIEGAHVSSSALARWTILEQRYPVLTDILARHPEWLDEVAQDAAPADMTKVPLPLRPFNRAMDARAVIDTEIVDKGVVLEPLSIDDVK